MIYKTCPNCGANIDPAEICDCQNPKEVVSEIVIKSSDDPVLFCITEVAINVLLQEQGSGKAEPAADLLQRHSTEAKAKALETVEKLAENEEYKDLSLKVAAMLRGDAHDN